jgi:predicted ATPase
MESGEETVCWRVELLGGLRAVSPVRTVHHFRTQRAGLLLAYLALFRGRSISREFLGEMLWPGEEMGVQRNRLRYELTVLRSILGQDALVRSGNTLVSLSEEMETDVTAFEAETLAVVRAADTATRLPHLRRALELYRTGLLPGILLPDSEYPTDDWLEKARGRLADAHYDLLTRLILDREMDGASEEAAQFRRLLAQTYPDRPVPPSPAPPPAPVSEPAPSGVACLIGRAAEVDGVRGWWADTAADSGLLTLTGFGGVGKTRLAQEALREIPTAFASLDGVGTTEELYVAIQRALGLAADARKPLKRQVREELRVRGRYALTLDGAEHLPRPTAEVAGELQAACPALKILVTSRRALRCPNERTLEVRPLEDAWAQQLFLARARAVRADFAATDQGQKSVGEIVRLLEGNPLALELAAARATVLGPKQIQEQLARQLGFLVSIRPRANRRHQSLRAALEWSISLLKTRTLQVLQSLSVFQGAFRFSGAEAVSGETPPVVDALEELRLHGLLEVAFEADSEEAEYRLLTPVAEYARETLEPGRRPEICARHLAYFEQEAESIGRLIRADNWREASARLRRDLANFRAATGFAAMEGGPRRLLRLVECLGFPYMELGLWEDFEALTHPVMALLPTMPPSPPVALILGWQAALARRRGDGAMARRWFQQRLRILETLGDAGGQVNTLFEIAGQAIDEGDADVARDALDRGSLLLDRWNLSGYSVNLAVLHARWTAVTGDASAIRQAADAAVSLLEHRTEAMQTRIYACTYLSTLYLDADAPDRAEPLLREAIPLCHQQARWFGLGVLLRDLARLRLLQGDSAAAATALIHATRLHEDLESRHAAPCRREMERLQTEYGHLPAVARAFAEASENGELSFGSIG